MAARFDSIAEVHCGIDRRRILAELEWLTRDTVGLLKATAQDASAPARQARARIATALERARAACDESQEQGVSTANAAAQKTDLVICEHPYESIGVAFGVGLLLGVLVLRCDRNRLPCNP